MGYIFDFIFYIIFAVTVPGTIELCFLTIGALLPKRPEREAFAQARFAVIIPAHNEEKHIARAVDSIKKCEGNYEVIVIADNCSDKTAQIAQARGAKVLERIDPHHRGKHFGLAFAFDQLADKGYEWFCIVDADSVVDENFFIELTHCVGCGARAIQAKYLVLNAGDSWRTRLMHVAFLAFNFLRPRARQNLGLSVGILGNGFALSAQVLKKVPYKVDSIVEDIAYHLRLVENRERVMFCDTTKVQGEVPVYGAGINTQRSRWEKGRLQLLKREGFHLLKNVISGNPYCLEPLLDLMLMPLAYHVVVLLPLLFFFPSYALFALGVVFVHVLVAIKIGGGNREDVKAVLLSPFYIVWKVFRLFAGKSADDWKRTER